jgi:hypothetical protein
MVSFIGKWMELEIIMLSEMSQAQKNKYCMYFLICGTRPKITEMMVMMVYRCVWGTALWGWAGEEQERKGFCRVERIEVPCMWKAANTERG